MHIRKKMVIGCALACLTSTALLPRQEKNYSEKNALQAFGAFVGGLVGGTVSFSLIPWLFNDTCHLNNFSRVASFGLKSCATVVSAYCGAKLFWYLTPEGTIEWSRLTIEQYGPTLESMVAENFYENLNVVFVSEHMPLFAAFNYVKCARIALISRRNSLNKLKNRNEDWKEEVDELLPRIERLLNLADHSLALITGHPDWARYLAIEEMRLARLTPQVHYIYR